MLRLLAAAIITCSFVGATTTVTAQEQQLAPAQKPVILKPKMRLALWQGAIQFIAGVELRGTEVDAYLDTRKAIVEAVEGLTKSGKKVEDEVVIELRLDQANNLFTLMQRGTVKAAEADLYKEIISALQDAAKAVQPK